MVEDEQSEARLTGFLSRRPGSRDPSRGQVFVERARGWTLSGATGRSR